MEKNKKESKDLTELSQFDIKITVEGIGLECHIHTADPLDCITLAGMVISHLRKNGIEPTVLVLP